MRYRRRWLAGIGVLAVTIVGAPVAMAGTEPYGTAYTWVGSSQDPHADNHSWTDARNWEPEGVPGDGDSVAISPPDSDHCAADVDHVPDVQLEEFSLSVAGLCSASVSGGSIEVAQAMSWDSGLLNSPVTLEAGAQAQFTTGAGKEIARNITVDGSLSLVGATVRLDDPHSITVSSGGALDSSGDSLISFSACCVTPAHVRNDGALSVTGTLDVDAVELDQNGMIDIGSGGLLNVSQAPMRASPGAQYAGSGRMQIWTQSEAVMHGKQSLGEGFQLELGDDGTDGSILGGSFTLAGAGTFDWSGGTMMANLTIAHGVEADLSGPSDGNGARVLDGEDTSGGGQGVPVIVTVHGLVVMEQQANLATEYGAHLAIAHDGSLSLEPGTVVSSNGCCVDKVSNAGGTVTVPADTGGYGPAQLVGVSYLAAKGTTSIAPGSELQLTEDAPSSLSDTTITGGGMLTVLDPTKIAKTVTVDSGTTLNLGPADGAFNGTGTISGAGSMLWTGGSLSGHLTIGPTGGLTLTGPDTKTVGTIHGGEKGSTINVTAPMTMAAGTETSPNRLDAGRSSMTFSGTTDINAYAELASGTLTNTGTFTIAPGASGTVSIDYNTVLANLGTLALASGTVVCDGIIQQAKGTTTLGAGTTLVESYSSHGLIVGGGRLSGTGLVEGDLVANGGIVDPGSARGSGEVGTRHVTGDYTQGGNAELAIDVAAKGADLLQVDGTASVFGTLLSHTMKGVHPGLGAKRTVARAADGLTWSLSCAITSGTDSAKGHWQPKAGAAAVRITWKSGRATSC